MTRYVRCARGEDHWGPWGAAGLWLRCGDLVLMQHRANWTHHGGTWGIPGGARGRAETAIEAALREASEETRLSLHEVEIEREHVDDHGGWSYVTVIAFCPTPLRVRGGIEGEVRWVPLVEARALLLHPGLASSWGALT
ncbi:NUDIX domain-containing protein [Kribbella sp. NBC_00482]|uniref:NUDIX domain-containing protein n=1 Tax=Kribbella sp. NBC_00482 TaxID=2975968 RepID=UPI002E18D409